MSDTPRIDHLLGTGRETFYTSELRMLSGDPAISKNPDPNFHIRFIDPDELGDEEPIQFVVTTPPRRAYPKYSDMQLRRSPKE